MRLIIIITNCESDVFRESIKIGLVLNYEGAAVTALVSHPHILFLVVIHLCFGWSLRLIIRDCAVSNGKSI